MESYKQQLIAELKRYRNDTRDSDSWLLGRVEVSLTAADCLEWLNGQECAEHFYFSSADHSQAFAGIGRAAVWDAFPSIESLRESGMPCFCLQPFDSGRDYDSDWGSFLKPCYLIPLIEFYSEGRLVCNLVVEPGMSVETPLARLCDCISGLRNAESVVDTLPSKFDDRSDRPDRDQWTTAVSIISDEIKMGRLEKAVLARETVFEFSRDLDALVVLKRLIDRTPGANHFLFTNDEGATFVGATPELLYKRNSCEISSQAVAATRSRGTTLDDDQRLEEELLSSKKEQFEHQLVADMVERRFKLLCSKTERGPVSVMKLTRLQHLYCEIRGRLLDGVSDQELLAILHPTPAVGGVPRAAALAVLRELEPFHRGCYSAPVGVVLGDNSLFMVAIRSALVSRNTLTAYAGAGIVDGSEALAEWHEVESKIGGIRGIFEV